jgi:hypothetical protein
LLPKQIDKNTNGGHYIINNKTYLLKAYSLQVNPHKALVKVPEIQIPSSESPLLVPSVNTKAIGLGMVRSEPNWAL